MCTCLLTVYVPVVHVFVSHVRVFVHVCMYLCRIRSYLLVCLSTSIRLMCIYIHMHGVHTHACSFCYCGYCCCCCCYCLHCSCTNGRMLCINTRLLMCCYSLDVLLWAHRMSKHNIERLVHVKLSKRAHTYHCRREKHFQISKSFYLSVS